MKRKVISSVIAGVLIFFVGGCCFSDADKVNRLTETNNKFKNTIERRDKTIEELNSENNELQNKVNELQSKVDEAAPYFEMKEEERVQMEEQTKKEKEEREAREKEEQERKAQEELEARTIELSNGNYVAGTDFEAGTYTITAVSGNGNVHSSNMFSGGLNAIMGTNNDGFYELEYKNIKLPVGTTLTIDGVTVRLTPSN